MQFLMELKKDAQGETKEIVVEQGLELGGADGVGGYNRTDCVVRRHQTGVHLI